MQLAQNAVHGAMAGYTAFSVGMVNDRTVSSEQHAERLVVTSPSYAVPSPWTVAPRRLFVEPYVSSMLRNSEVYMRAGASSPCCFIFSSVGSDGVRASRGVFR